MFQTRFIMGMAVTIGVRDEACQAGLEDAFALFAAADDRFSQFKSESELSQINRGECTPENYSADMRAVLDLAEDTRARSFGFFDIRRPDGTLDPSGIVKGWAIREAARVLAANGHEHFYVEAGGDIQTSGLNKQGGDWRVGIRNPFRPDGIVKTLHPRDGGVATSGTYLLGSHIYNPHTGDHLGGDIISLTVIGPDVFEADRFATAAFAMGRDGIGFIESLDGFEAYEIDASGKARMTSGMARLI